jgi:hypothetical protein
MPNYEINQEIIEISGQELKKIGEWNARHDDASTVPSIVLIGDWAVDAYNPYLGSVDIDLVTNSHTRHSLMHYLQQIEGYEYDDLYPFGKTVLKTTPHGIIVLDFISKNKSYPFEGHPKIPFSFEILSGNTELMRVRGGAEIAVPNRSILILLKLKAAWDRSYRIEHGNPFINEEHERSKWIKDCADLLALIDPDSGGREIDLEILGREVSRFKFLKDVITRIPAIDPARKRYGRMDLQAIQTVCDNLISII